MVRLKVFSRSSGCILLNYLHSNMVRLKGSKIRGRAKSLIHLHSNMVRLKVEIKKFFEI